MRDDGVTVAVVWLAYRCLCSPLSLTCRYVIPAPCQCHDLIPLTRCVFASSSITENAVLSSLLLLDILVISCCWEHTGRQTHH